MAPPVELTREECLDLLQGGVVGRVGFVVPDGPRIVPVNYAMYGDDVVFRTTSYSELGSYASGADVAFEVDHLDLERHQGWSVVLVGRATAVDDPDEVAEIRRCWEPRPWADGLRNLFVKVVGRTLTGRRLGADWTRSTMTPARRVL